MPLESTGYEAALNKIRDNAVSVRLYGEDTALPPGATWNSGSQTITWGNPLEEFGVWKIVYDINAASADLVFLIEPDDNESIEVQGIEVRDSSGNSVIDQDITGILTLSERTFERDGEFTIEELQVAVE